MRQTYEAKENALVPITMQAVVTAGRSALKVKDPEGRTCTVEGPAPEQARTADLTEDMLRCLIINLRTTKALLESSEG